MSRAFFLFLICSLGVPGHAEISGLLRPEEQFFLQNQPGSVPRSEEALTITFEERNQLSDSWKIRFEPRVRVSSTRNLTDVPVDGDFRDTQVEMKKGPLRMAAGSFMKIWEGTDGLNPMDIASVRNYRDPLAVESIGSVGVTAAWAAAEHFSFDALYVPWQTPTRLPGSGSPWWPHQSNLPIEQGNFELRLPESTQYAVMHHETLDSALNNNWGLRAQYHHGSWDFSVATFEGAAQIPLLQPSIYGDLIQSSPKTIIQMSNPIAITPVEYRRRTYSAALVATEESWIFRLAGRYDQPVGNELILPGWSDQLVGGVEKTMAVWSQTVILVVQGAYEDMEQTNHSVISSADPFQRALLLGLRLPFSDELLLFTSGLLDLKGGSSVARVNLQYKLTGHFSIDGTAEWIHGNSSTVLGQWSDRSRLMAAASFQF